MSLPLNYTALRTGLVAVLLSGILANGPDALANGGGEGGAAGPAPMNFVINIGRTGRGGTILQLQVVTIPASPEAAKLIEAYKPMLQHCVIQVVSAMKPEELRDVADRNKLAARLTEELNAELNKNEKTGIKEVFFTSFVFQQM